MANQPPTDEYCKPGEHILERGNTWFILDPQQNQVRIHPEEYPEELRNSSDVPYSPPKPSNALSDLFGMIGLTAACTVLLPVLIPFLMIAGLWAEVTSSKDKERSLARAKWEEATYLNAGFDMPVFRQSRAAIASPDPTWGV